MTEPSPSSHEIIGDPPTLVRPLSSLPSGTVRRMLEGSAAEELLVLLGIDGEDRADLLPLLGRAAADEEILEEITRTAALLREGAGLEARQADLAGLKDRHTALQQRLAPGEGLIAILALMVSTDVVRAWHRSRGLSEELSWEVLADLGQQMRVHRAGSGRLGLHQLPWLALNWRGRLMQLGRLQFDLHRTEKGTERERWTIGVHIPARGPLDPAAVDDSLDRATAYFSEHFADLGAHGPAGSPPFGREFECDSWLVNPVLAEALGPESNLGAFARRWSIVSSTPGADSAAFFVFGARPPYDPAAFPRTTRLEREVAARLSDGRGWDVGRGVLVR